MMKNLTLAISAIALIVFTSLGISNIRNSDHQIQLKTIELKDTSIELKRLNQKYDQLLENHKVNEKELNQIRKEKKRLEKELVAKLERERAEAVALQHASSVTAVAEAFSGSKSKLLKAAGIASEDWAAADFIINHEGHYDPCVRYGGISDCSYAINGGQAAYGVCQALPGSKMASAGSDWATNTLTQLKWCNSYAKARYGGWWQAYNYWQTYRVW